MFLGIKVIKVIKNMIFMKSIPFPTSQNIASPRFHFYKSSVNINAIITQLNSFVEVEIIILHEINIDMHLTTRLNCKNFD